MRDVDLVIPVYDGFEETRACLETVFESIDLERVRVVCVDDCSPRPEISSLLRDHAIKYADSFILLENEENLGFVASVNRGMSHCSTRDVLLLNSDVEVTGNWIERLFEAAYSNDNIGSVTPFSNNATICSFPNFCADNSLPFGLSVQELDEAFAAHAKADEVFDIPTGVGFCMYIRRDCLDEVGLFDVETFGRGYGEENDWCQRAITHGWRNVHLANCFVYHKGAVSFGKENSPRVAAAMQLLDEKHPSYHQSVQDYVASDPAARCRLRVLLQLLAQQNKPKVLFVSHSLGGGAQQHIDELAALYAEDAIFLQIAPLQAGTSVSLSVFDRGQRLNDNLYFEVERDYDNLLALLRQLGVGRLHFHHTMGLPARLWGLSQDLACDFDVSVHDYYLVNSNPTLTDDAAYFVGDGSADFDEQCAQHYALPAGVDVTEWRQSQQDLLDKASRVIFPSQDCKQRFDTFFELKNAVVCWHPDYWQSQPYPEPSWRYVDERPLRVVVLGALSREKGADVLESVALSMRGQKIEFHLLGYAYRALDAVIKTHGPYKNDEIDSLLVDIEPDVIWYPALWPETYSYTLSIALRHGYPVVVPNIGAFVERVANRPLSSVQPWRQSPRQWSDFWKGVIESKSLPDSDYTQGNSADLQSENFYQRAYLQVVAEQIGNLSEAVLSKALEHRGSEALLSRKERVLALVWRWSRLPIVSRLVALVPFRLQQAIKRFFSSKPLHEIVRK